MRLRILKSGSLALSRLNPLEVDALLRIPQHADPTDVPEAKTRLFQNPVVMQDFSETPGVASMNEDWQDYVIPEMEQLFAGCIDEVRSDLGRLRPHVRKNTPPPAESEGEEEAAETTVQFRLTIPRANTEAWFRAMNQARLVMAEKELWIPGEWPTSRPAAVLHPLRDLFLLPALAHRKRSDLGKKRVFYDKRLAAVGWGRNGRMNSNPAFGSWRTFRWRCSRAGQITGKPL